MSIENLMCQTGKKKSNQKEKPPNFFAKLFCCRTVDDASTSSKPRKHKK